MSGQRQAARENARRLRAAVKEAKEGLALERAVVWYARTVGTQEAPWLIRAGSDTFRAERVCFGGDVSTRLLSDEEREQFPDKPRGVLDAENVRAFGARLILL